MNNDRFRFRVWDRQAKVMHYLGAVSDTELLDCGLIIMQCTGLQDKNGMLIWEGDILDHPFWGAFVVVWEYDGFSVQNEKYGVVLEPHQVQQSKVISNRYENPELLMTWRNKHDKT